MPEKGGDKQRIRDPLTVLKLAMDGLSLLLVILTLLLGLIAIVSSWSEIEFKPGLFQANLL